jgi:16S rRNA (cytosine1402-N4)-methyltransferase
VTSAPGHQPVLLQEALEGLSLRNDGWYVDATYGRGGHSAEILARLGPQGRLLALDKDADAVADARERLGADSRFRIEHAGFEELSDAALPWLGERRADGILFDLGVSSPQLDEAERGFSFAHDGPLDMRMNRGRGPTAAEWLAAVPQRELADVLFRYGEEPRARQIAAAIVRARATAPLRTTAELAALVAAHAGRQPGRSRVHPATRTFQAIRIAVNDELGALERGLAHGLALLAARGRLAVISFHSLEDRIVKRFMAREARGDEAYAGLPDIPPHARPRLKLVGKLVRPGAAEVERNPRARSARLRVAERVPLEQAA